MAVPSVFLWHSRNFVDCFSRESLDTHVDQSLNGEGVVRVLSNIEAIGVKPTIIKTDYASEFVGKVMDKLAQERDI